MGKVQFDFYENDTRQVLREFRELVGGSDLFAVISKVDHELQERKIVSQALLDRYSVSLGLRESYRYLKSTGRAARPRKSRSLYAAFTFAASAVALSRQLSRNARPRLVGMIRDNLSLAGDSRRLQHELTVAAHFSQHGWEMTFVDFEGEGNFDYLVSKGGIEADVECKTVSGDTGNVIHQVDALRFMENIYRPLIEGMPDAWWTLDITFPGRLPKTRQEHLALGDRIAKCMRDGRTMVQGDGVTVHVNQKEMPILGSASELHTFAQAAALQIQSRLNGHVGSIYNRKHLFSVCVSSTRPTRTVSYTYESIKHGCQQLSGKRAGHIWTHFVDLSEKDLARLEGESRNAFDYISARIFKNENRRHVSALSYSADGEIRLSERRSRHMISRSYSKGGFLPTHYSSVAAFPLSPDCGFPCEPEKT